MSYTFGLYFAITYPASVDIREYFTIFPTERHYNRVELHVRAILTGGQRVFENTNTYYYIP